MKQRFAAWWPCWPTAARTARGRTAPTASPWGIAVWPSSTWPADSSRCPTKTARSGSSSTARSTTSASCGAGWKRPGTASDAQRYRNGRPPLRRRRARVRPAPQRDVRPGHLGRPSPPARPGPRPAGQEAAGLPAGARPAAVRQRTEEPAGGARRAARTRPAGTRRVPHLSIRPAPADDLPRHRTSCRRATWRSSATAGSTCSAIGSRISRRGRPAGRGLRRRVAGAADLVGRDASAERRAAGRVPLRRDGLDDRGRPDAAAQPASRCGPSRSAFRSPSTTRPATPGSWPSGIRDAAPRSFASSRTRSRSCRSWCGTTTSRLPTTRRSPRGTSPK